MAYPRVQQQQQQQLVLKARFLLCCCCSVVLLLLLVEESQAFLPQRQRLLLHLQPQQQQQQPTASTAGTSPSSRYSFISMDVETPPSPPAVRFTIPRTFSSTTTTTPLVSQQQQSRQATSSTTSSSSSSSSSVTAKNSNDNKNSVITLSHGMPWKASIDPKYPTTLPLPYMKFWEWQLNYMQRHLSNLHEIPIVSNDDNDAANGVDLTCLVNEKKPARIYTKCFASDEYSKIRMTVYDAGHATQVFNSLWYPRPLTAATTTTTPGIDVTSSSAFVGPLPVLGIDLLQFHHATKHLCVMDFQPLIQEDHTMHCPNFMKWWSQYQHNVLKPIRDQYPALQGKMSPRFYDENLFFSKQMLFGRFEKHQGLIEEQVFPAFQQYVQQHVALVQGQMKLIQQQQQQQQEEISGDGDDEYLSWHDQQQAAYDTYSAERDPAHGLLTNAFGKDIADRFVYHVLFSKSQNKPQQQPQQPMP